MGLIIPVQLLQNVYQEHLLLHQVKEFLDCELMSVQSQFFAFVHQIAVHHHHQFLSDSSKQMFVLTKILNSYYSVITDLFTVFLSKLFKLHFF